MLNGRDLVTWEFCTKDLTKLCPKVFVGHEEAEWFEKQGNKSCKKKSSSA
jgi:hypothetical protein